LPSIIGIPAVGEKVGGRVFDGETEAVLFPGDLPEDPAVLIGPNAPPFQGTTVVSADAADYRFLRFRPPKLEILASGIAALPHIRLDRALQFLVGDRLQ
jgi:predicted YcjX-like family ATPase